MDKQVMRKSKRQASDEGERDTSKRWERERVRHVMGESKRQADNQAGKGKEQETGT